MGRIAAPLTVKVDLAVTASRRIIGRWFAGAIFVLRLEAFHGCPCLDQRAIDRKMIARQ
jgi:hypothetical protein